MAKFLLNLLETTPMGVWFGLLFAAGALMAAGAVIFRVLQSRRVDDAEKAATTQNPTPQEKAINAYTVRLRYEIDGLRLRALVSFIPGMIMCMAAASGPGLAYGLATSTGRWEFMIGGSTVAAVFLAAGSTLLRHDNKIRDQIQLARNELLYFSRIKAGLDCAQEIGSAEYAKRLRDVIGQLLAAPPDLRIQSTHPHPDGEGQKASPLATLEIIRSAGETAKTLLGPGEPKR